MVGRSPAILRIHELVDRVAPTDLPILIQGETGVGKELVARAVHEQSHRTGRFVTVNVCAISDSMFEDALFGHVRGAFTGAVHDRPGLMTESDRGTLFLDEVGSMPRPAQAKLLRCIETGEYRTVGASRDSRSDFRVVSATNVPLAELVSQGQFRADLAHRLAGFVINVPALADRREDIEALAKYFAGTHAQHTAPGTHLSRAAICFLQAHNWPGNVRELKRVMERALVLADQDRISLDNIVHAMHCGVGSPVHDPVPGHGSPGTRREMLALCAAHHWKADRIAQALGIARATLYRRLVRLGISLREGRRQELDAISRVS